MPDNITIFSQTVRDWETHRSDEPFSDMSELKNIILFVSKMYIFRVKKNPMSKLNGGTMLILVVLIASVEAY